MTDEQLAYHRFLQSEWYRMQLEIKQLHEAHRRKSKTIKRLRSALDAIKGGDNG